MIDKMSKQGMSPQQDEVSPPLVTLTVNSTPKVCLVDMEADVHALLAEKLYDCTTATLGGDVSSPKKSPGTQSFLRPLVKLPANLHEFHVVVVDLSKTDVVDESEARAELKGTSGKTAYAIVSSYPEQVFNSKGYGSERLSREIREVTKKESIVVVFAAENHSIRYDLAEIGMHGSKVVERLDCDTLRVCDGVRDFKNKFGERVELYKEETRFHPVLKKYLDGATYEVVFSHPTVWKSGKYEPDENFIPLLTNAIGEIVGYLAFEDKGAVFVLPQITRKSDFLIELFDNLAAIFPGVFPYNGMFGWLDDGSYPLPGEQEIRKARIDIEEKYLADIAGNDAAITKLKDEYSFLRVMLSGTGEELVSAVRDYLVWLGFSSAEAMDEHSEDVLEEDIQVQLDPGLLVIEVKGIGGTSKDKECAQVAKIKNRRQEERRAWDVSALYIVNHQRYVSPKLRVNPPFTSNQIKDAHLDKRGLITTYQLYNAYFDILRGLVTKDEVRKQLLAFGHVEIVPPDLVEVGTIEEVFQQGRIAILKLGGAMISVGTKLYVLKNNVYDVRHVIGLQLNGVDVNEATDGEVGIQLNEAVKKGSRIYVSA
ncbi:hypothetical protein [Pseudomonas sp. GD03696]|uniref:hypothetical protein n=1 Tax=Pseudomonas sp. GD03696 TaxID=2975368 RepID=UPI00244751F5|nr:hypothetical protein [Pseudomonas sp. GD03696]MDH1930487.1 hypothetical protein [Pseudomonas sp. GD03696]